MSENKRANSLATGVAGAVIGAAAAAAAIALSDEKNRKKAEKILNDLQHQGNRVLKEITRRALDLKDMVNKAPVKEAPKKLKAKAK